MTMEGANTEEKVPQNFDLYPHVYREFKDGGHVRPMTEEEKEALKREPTGQDTQRDSPDLHPQVWKQFVDNHSPALQDKPVDPKNPPEQWDMYPNVYRQYVDEAGIKEPTAQYIIDNHKVVTGPVSESGAKNPDLYPQKWREADKQ